MEKVFIGSQRGEPSRSPEGSLTQASVGDNWSNAVVNRSWQMPIKDSLNGKQYSPEKRHGTQNNHHPNLHRSFKNTH